MRAARVREEDSIEAACLWHGVIVRIRTPWIADDMIDAPLSAGVVRRVDFHNTHVVEYVYDNMFRLRGISRSCLQRQLLVQ